MEEDGGIDSIALSVASSFLEDLVKILDQGSLSEEGGNCVFSFPVHQPA